MRWARAHEASRGAEIAALPGAQGQASPPHGRQPWRVAALLCLLGLPSCAPDSAPVASFTSTTNPAVGAVVVLDGSESEPRDSALHRWALVVIPPKSRATLNHSHAPIVSFVPDQPGEYVVQLVVHAGALSSEPVYKQIEIEACDGSTLAAELKTIAPEVVGTGSTVLLEGSRRSGSDLPPCGGVKPVSCAWSFVPPQDSQTRLRSANGCTVVFTPDLPGPYRADLTVADERGQQSPPTSTTITVVGCGFYAPVAVTSPHEQTVVQGQPVLLDGTGSFDPDNDPSCGHHQWLRYLWLLVTVPDGSRAHFDNPRVVAPSFLPDVPGEYRAQLVVMDSTNQASQAAEVTIAALPLPGQAEFKGTIGSVSARPPLTLSGDGAARLGIQGASGDDHGFVSAIDWRRFGAKPALGAGAAMAVTGTSQEPVVSVLFGANAGTVAEGNDSRLTNEREPSPGSSHYLANQTISSQAASFRIRGDGGLDGDLAVARIVDAPFNLEIVAPDDARLSYQPALANCAAGEWCETENRLGSNRFSERGRYTLCKSEADCSGNHVELHLAANRYRSVLLSHLDWNDSRQLGVYLSFDDGLNYTFHKAINTYRRTSGWPYVSSLRTLVSNLPLDIDVRVRVVAQKGRFYFEGFGLSSLVLPETDARPFRSIARASGSGPEESVCSANAPCGPSSLGSRRLVFIKTQDHTAVRVQYIDNMSSWGTGTSCRYYIRFDGGACPGAEVFADVDAPTPSYSLRSRTMGGYCTDLPAGAYTVQVYVGNTPGRNAQCWTGWTSNTWLLEAEEIL